MKELGAILALALLVWRFVAWLRTPAGAPTEKRERMDIQPRDNKGRFQSPYD